MTGSKQPASHLHFMYKKLWYVNKWSGGENFNIYGRYFDDNDCKIELIEKDNVIYGECKLWLQFWAHLGGTI